MELGDRQDTQGQDPQLQDPQLRDGEWQGVASLKAFLRRHGLEAELVNTGAEMPTVELAAMALGVAPAQIVKSVVFQHKRDDERVCIAVIPGDRQAERAKVGEALGLPQLKLASPAVVLAATGFPAGGVAPVGHRRSLPVVVATEVLEHAVVYGGGGEDRHMLKIDPRNIVRLTSATVADVCVAAPAAPAASEGRGEQP